LSVYDGILTTCICNILIVKRALSHAELLFLAVSLFYLSGEITALEIVS